MHEHFTISNELVARNYQNMTWKYKIGSYPLLTSLWLFWSGKWNITQRRRVVIFHEPTMMASLTNSLGFSSTHGVKLLLLFFTCEVYRVEIQHPPESILPQCTHVFDFNPTFHMHNTFNVRKPVCPFPKIPLLTTYFHQGNEEQSKVKSVKECEGGARGGWGDHRSFLIFLHS